MILSLLDSTLHHLFLTRLTTTLGGSPVTEEQVRFQSSDEDWLTWVAHLGAQETSWPSDPLF